MRRIAGLVAALLAATAGPASAADYHVEIPGNYYAPAHLVVLLGDRVTWTNTDTASHTVTASGSFASGVLGHGGTFSRTFDVQGTFAYVCTIHRFMRGEVEVYGMVLEGPADALAPGDAATLNGRAPEGTREVTIERYLPEGDPVPIATVPAEPDGTFSYVVTPNLPTRYRAVAGDRVSADVLVSVGAVVRLRVAGRSGRAVRLEVTTSPAQVGARVVLERYVRERFAWMRVRAARLGAQSRARFRYEPKRPVLVRARLVEGVDGYGPALSNERRLWPQPG